MSGESRDAGKVLDQKGSKLKDRVRAVLLGSEWTAGRAGRVMTQAEGELQPWTGETNRLSGNPNTEGEHGRWKRQTGKTFAGKKNSQ